ncbi:MAG TPA: MFS transporter, partial [Acidimicrobiales bacterium]|nr:MFS transporter [Acidimicrobiales bacterium]
LPLYVYAGTGSALSTSFVLMSSTLPGLLLGPIVGGLTDRWPCRATMIVTDLGRAAVLAILLAGPFRHLLWVVYVVAVVEASLAQFFSPARTAALPAIVRSGHLPAANAAVAAGSELALLGGPALGGLVYAAAGLPLSVGLDLATYVVSAGSLTLLRVPPLRGRPSGGSAAAGRRRGLFAELAVSVRLTRTNPSLRGLLVVTVVLFTAGGLIGVLIVPFARGQLHATGIDYGLVLSAQAVGGLLGAAIAAPALGRFGSVRAPMTLCLAVIAVIVAALSATSRWELAAACLLIGGAPTTISGVITTTLLQTAAGDRHRGRLTGLYSAAAALGTLVGSPAAGLLAGLVGVRPSLAVCAAVFALSGLLALATFPAQPLAVTAGQ